jgi:hypothetical protein
MKLFPRRLLLRLNPVSSSSNGYGDVNSISHVPCFDSFRFNSSKLLSSFDLIAAIPPTFDSDDPSRMVNNLQVFLESTEAHLSWLLVYVSTSTIFFRMVEESSLNLKSMNSIGWGPHSYAGWSGSSQAKIYRRVISDDEVRTKIMKWK